MNRESPRPQTVVSTVPPRSTPAMEGRGAATPGPGHMGRMSPSQQLESASRLSPTTAYKASAEIMRIPRVMRFVSTQRRNELLERLYNRDRHRKAEITSQLDRKYYGDASGTNTSANAGAMHTREDIDTLVDRMYSVGMQKKKDKHQKLNAKYLEPLSKVGHFKSQDEEKIFGCFFFREGSDSFLQNVVTRSTNSLLGIRRPFPIERGVLKTSNQKKKFKNFQAKSFQGIVRTPFRSHFGPVSPKNQARDE